ncbi:helix-turn-helix domain-containing protein [Microbacterium sp. 179-I 3D3 NHS]|uniref:helix-turn-helix domain-containing protein n=1 Tax=unclassified Microbacterium TaxID=2609290 RepID=UPI0039A163F7
MKTSADQYNAAVGVQIRAEIGAHHSSIAAMARTIGIARSALDNYVTGKRAIPIPIVYAVCAAVGLEPHQLLRRAEERLETTGTPAGARITPLRRSPDVSGSRDDVAEVAFRSHLRHDADTDDLYD